VKAKFTPLNLLLFSRGYFTGVQIRGRNSSSSLIVHHICGYNSQKKMPNSLYIITGPPRSGLNLLASCLNILGISALKNNNQPDAVTINSLLLQDLGLSSFTPSLPPDWLNTDAASNAKSRIKNLLQSSRIFDKYPHNFSGVKREKCRPGCGLSAWPQTGPSLCHKDI